MATNEDRIKVLLVEDSPSDAQLLGELLQDYPLQRFAMERAERLEDAIRLVEARTFDVVLLDLTLPDSTGLDTCTRMRQAAPHVPIVVLTGVDDETIALEAMRQGVNDYLVKGQIHGGTVGRATRYAVERSRSELALRESEERFRATYEQAAIGIEMLSLDGRLLRGNGTLCRILGYDQQELQQRRFSDITHLEDLPWELSLLEDLLAGRIPSYTIEKRYLHKDGHSVWARVTSSLARVAKPYRISIIEDITERKRAEEQLVRLNRTLRALSSSSQALMHAAEESAYLQEVCKIVVEDCGHAMVWIGYAEPDEAKSVRPVAHAGFEEGYLETLRITWADTERGRGPTGTALRTGQPRLCRNMLTDPNFAPWREQAIKRGYASSIALPLLSGGKPFGVITIYSRKPDPFSEDEVELLVELAADLAYGITSLRLRAAHALAEEAVRESEQRLRLALEGGRMGRWEWDLRSDTSFWDERVYELLGLDRHVPVANGIFFDLIDEHDRDAVRQLVEKSLAGGEDFQAEFRVRHAKGETLWLISRGKVVREEHGQAVRMMGVMYDITQRKQMEADLRRLNDHLEEEVHAQTEELKDTVGRLQEEVARRVLAEDQLRRRSQMLEAFFQHTIAPLAFMDKDFNFVRVNEAYAQADGKEPEYFAGKNHFALYPHEENQRIFEQVVQTKQPYFAHAKPFTYPDAPQRVSFWDWQLTPLLDERCEVQFLVLNLEDVTEQQTAFQELEHRARQLQKLTLELSQAEDRERKRLAGILHDDLQQQLAAARFHLSLLSRRVSADPATQQTVAQIDQILKDSIERSRSLSHELSPVVLYQSDLGETFEWLARQLKDKHGLRVDVESRGRVNPSSEPLKVFLYRTAQEILFNVVKHARVKEARLRVQWMHGRVWVTISDRGRGFDPRSLGKADGFGLLSIRERIELLGGRMKIRSAPGRGSTFLIAVPDGQEAEDRGQRTEDGGQRAEGAAVIRHLSSGHRLRVLLVDDQKVMREGLAALLNEQPDLEVVGQAGDGREAVDLAYQLQPDVVVTDVSMPVMTGAEVARQIKLHWPEVRIVALSMFEEADMAEAMRQAGAETYLLKTAPSDELLAAIRGSKGLKA
jgi:PAS domain S-box-containing protein